MDNTKAGKYTSIKVPARIGERWRSERPENTSQFHITTALSEANVNAEDFKKCWRTVQPTIPKEELVRLFNKTFGSENNLHHKVNFIKDILRRYQDSSIVIREAGTVSVEEVSPGDKDVSRERVVPVSQRLSMKLVGSQTQISTRLCGDELKKMHQMILEKDKEIQGIKRKLSQLKQENDTLTSINKRLRESITKMWM